MYICMYVLDVIRMLFCRTWGHLIYVCAAAFKHFTILRDMYHLCTHKYGRVSLSHERACRSMSEQILSDKGLKQSFKSLSNLHSEDVEVVWKRYVMRIETMVGNELSSQGNETLKREKKGNTMESLRKVKGDINTKVKLDV